MIWLFMGVGSVAYAQPTADFSSDVIEGCAPLTVNFRDLSGGSNLSHRWSFGNGNQSNLQHPQAIYYQAGTYEVSLTVTDPNNQSNTLRKKAYIKVYSNPKADFTVDIPTGCSPLAVTFRDKSTPGDTAITHWRWDFGDGTVKDGRSIELHTYQLDGKFTVSLELTDGHGCKDKLVKSAFTEVKKSPEVDFNANKLYDCQTPFNVKFSSEVKPPSGSYTYAWNFGDGGQSTDANPNHTYQAKSSFNVSLTVTSSNGCKTIRNKPDYISTEPLNPDFTLNSANGCVPYSPILRPNLKLDHPDLSYEWDLGNGQTSKLKIPVVKYESAGLYTVSLSVSLNGKCTDRVSKPGVIQVLNSPKAFFEGPDTFSCDVPKTFRFINKSTGAISYDWRYSTGQTSSRDLNYTFTTFNDHEVRLIVVNAANCKDTFTQKIIMRDPEVKIDADPPQGCEPLSVRFTDQSYAYDGIVRRFWDFGDGERASDVKEISHMYRDSGTYVVKLKIITGGNCEREDSIRIRVGKKTNPSFIPKKDTICNGDVVRFENTTQATAVVDRWSWLVDGKQFSSDSNGVLMLKLDTGWHDVTLVSYNNGCPDSFPLADQIYVLPPLAAIQKIQDSCDQSHITLINRSLLGPDPSYFWSYQGNTYPQQDTLMLSLPKGIHYFRLFVSDKTYGCSDALRDTVEVNRELSADFGLPSAGCAPATVRFQNRSKGDLIYRWNLGNGDSAIDLNPQATYSGSGTYSIRLIAIDRGYPSCRDTAIKEISISGPEVEGSISGSYQCPPLPLRLRSDSDPKEFNRLFWRISGPTGEKEMEINQKGEMPDTLWHPGFAPSGHWDISLIGIDSNGCVGKKDFRRSVNGLQSTGMRIGVFAECTGLRYTFAVRLPVGTNTDKMSFEWDMGNGHKSTLVSQSYTYEKPGVYPIRLKVTDSLGCTSTYFDTIDVEGRRLKARLAADNTETDCPPFLVSFFDQSQAPDRRIVSYEWDFGDGSRSVLRNPRHNYVKAGKFTVTLKIVDEWGCHDSIVYKDLILVNGPEGDYSFDRKEGCVPLEVRYNAVTKGASSMEWDMGDGNVIKDSLSYLHTYRDTGRYIPLLILSDSFGCKYTLPPIDTIYVRPFPEPALLFNGPCAGQPTSFVNVTPNLNGGSMSCNWDFGDGSVSDQCNPIHMYGASGNYQVRLEVTNQYGCKRSIDTLLRIRQSQAAFGAESGYACVGRELNLTDQSESDTIIVRRWWRFEDGTIDTSRSIQKTYEQVGPVNIQLVILDALGCYDTLQSSTHLVIGDTLPPQSTVPLRITVENDFAVRFEHLASNISDFKAYRYFMHKGAGFDSVAYITNVKDTSLLLRGLNTLDDIYCVYVQVENTCGINSLGDSLEAHCSVNVEARGDTNVSLVHWSAYKGWNEVEHYEIWREREEEFGEYDYLASVSGDSLSYHDSTIKCHAEHRYRIMAYESGGYRQESQSDTAHAVPIWHNIIPLNELRVATVRLDEYNRIFWDSTPRPRVPVIKYQLEKSLDGKRWLSAEQSEFLPDERVYDDRQVRVDDHYSIYRVRAYDACGDVSGWSNEGQTILLTADTTLTDRPYVYWTHYRDWKQGISKYEVQRVEPDGSFTHLGFVNPQDTVFIDEVSDWNKRPSYCYRVLAYRQSNGTEAEVISISNEDCAPVRSRIYVPNAFTPNGDGLNDRFLLKGLYVKEFLIKIYNRWGEQLYESNNLDEGWDGIYQGEASQMDVYIYTVESIGVDGVKRNFEGNVHLVK